ncbi:MAG: hypothetical protein H0U19_12760 [Acidobacteria bacterium]|nr:hypothetical protein [Acidobacteriota bacterium]
MTFTGFHRATLLAAALGLAVSIQGASFSPDESRILFSSNKTGIWNVYTIGVGGSTSRACRM